MPSHFYLLWRLQRQICCYALSLLVACGFVSSASAAESSVAPLAPSVLLFHKPHHHDGPGQVKRIADAGFKHLQVVATLFVRIDENRRVVEYGRLSGRRFVPLDKPQQAAFREGLVQTFRAAAERGIQVAVVAHLNSAGPVHDWRNNFAFDPRAEYGGYTYEQAMVQPIMDAIRSTPLAEAPVDFAVAGEMGRTLLSYPEAYAGLIRRLRATAGLPQVRLGVSLNFTHVAGEGRGPEATPAEAQALFEACDFLGMSNYRWFEPPPRPEQFRQAIEAMLAELKMHGVVWDVAKPLHFTEIGLGGGMPGPRVATTPLEAAKTPWEGFGPRQANPWDNGALRQLRRDYHRALLDFLRTQTKLPRVSAAYLWSEGSWDPIGTLDTGFEDRAILEQMQAQ